MSVEVRPGRARRLFALLLLLLAGGLIYGLVDRVLIARYRFYQINQEQLQDRLEQLKRTAEIRPQLEALIGRIQQDRIASDQYLQQPSPALAAADLQQRVKTVVETAGGNLQSIQVLPTTEEGNLVKIAVGATITGDAESPQKILYGLESQTPLLFVDSLDIAARELRPRLPNGRVADYLRVQLTMQLEVSGYLRK